MNAPLLPDDHATWRASEAHEALRELHQDLHRISRQVRRQIQTQLQPFAGRSLESLAENRQLAVAIAELLDSHGLRVRCSQCGHAAILRVSPRKSMPGGAFVFDHTIDRRRTFHGGFATVPPLVLTAKPTRRKTGR